MGTTGGWPPATRGSLPAPQKPDADAGRFFGVVFEAVVPIGVFEPDLEHGIAGERQSVAAGRQADHAVPGSVAAGAMDEHPRSHLVFRVERLQLTAVLVQEPLGGTPKRLLENGLESTSWFRRATRCGSARLT